MVSFALLLLGLASISQCCVVPFTGNFSLRQDYCKQVQPGEKPYQISVATSSYVHLCSGALITFSFAITAARCIFNYKPSAIYVVTGTVVLEGSSSWIGYVNEIITPREYNISKPCLNDIALLALSGYFPSINTIGIVSLPTLFVSQNEFNKVKSAVFTVSGYEKVEYRNLPDYRYYFGVYNQYLLFKDDERILTSRNNCTTYYWRRHCFISQTQICTYHGSTKSEENQINIRDEGALLVYNGTLFGIASCASDYYYKNCLYSEQLPNVFTDITQYVFWIQSEISARRARQTTS